MLSLREADEARPVQGADRRIKRSQGVGRRFLQRRLFAGACRFGGYIEIRNFYVFGRGLNKLNEFAALPSKDSPPGLVTPDNLGKSPFESSTIHWAITMDRDRLVVNRHLGRKLGVQPDLLLSVRCRDVNSVGA